MGHSTFLTPLVQALFGRAEKTEDSAENDGSFTIEGRVTRLGREGAAMVGGQSVVIAPNAWVIGDLQVGAHCQVRGSIGAENTRLAKKIVVRKRSG